MSDTEAYIMPDDPEGTPPPPKVKAVPAYVDTSEDGLLSPSDPYRAVTDINTAKMAMNRGWAVPNHLRAKILERAEKIIDKTHVVVGVDQDGQPIVSDAKADDLALRAGALVLAADNHDQADRHLDEKNKRLDEGKATERVIQDTYTVTFDGGGTIKDA